MNMKQGTFEKFIKELEPFKNIPFPITTEETWYGCYQHSDSEKATYLEDGEDLMTAEDYAETNGVDHETQTFNLEGDGIIDPTKEIEKGYVVESGTADWTLADFFDEITYDDYCYAYGLLNDAINEVISCAPACVHGDESKLIQSIQDYPDSKLLWYSNYEIESINHEPDYPKEVWDIIEKYEDLEED